MLIAVLMTPKYISGRLPSYGTRPGNPHSIRSMRFLGIPDPGGGGIQHHCSRRFDLESEIHTLVA